MANCVSAAGGPNKVKTELADGFGGTRSLDKSSFRDAESESLVTVGLRKEWVWELERVRRHSTSEKFW